MRRSTFTLVLSLVLAVAVVVPLAAQLVEEDLPEPEVWQEVLPTFEEAEQLFNSRDQPDSIAVFDEFLRQVQEKATLDPPTDEIWDLVARAYFYRAQVNTNLGATEDAASDITQLLAVDPGFTFDRALVSSKLAQQFDTIRNERVAAVLVTVDPPDAKVTVGRWQADLTGMISLPIGEHTARVERPGYAPVDLPINAESGSGSSFEVVLERTAAVLTLYTDSDGIEVLIDGQSRGETEYIVAGDPSQGAAITLDGLQTGAYELAARRDGFRDYLATVDVAELQDYSLGPIQLVPTSGVVNLASLPPGTVVRANGEQVTPSFGSGGASLDLKPGDYVLSMAHPDRGLFEARVRVEDQKTHEVVVRLRPPLVLLGILGGDTSTATRVTEMLDGALADVESWALIDRSTTGEELIAAAGVELSNLRTFAQTGSRQAIPWDRVQAEAESRAPEGAVYMLGVLSDDLLADTVHMFLFPEPPLPSRPDRVDLTLDASVVEALADLLDETVLVSRPSLGAILVDSPAANGPVAVQVSSGGAAELAGVNVGDEIVGLGGTPIATVSDLERELETKAETHAQSGQTIAMQVRGSAGAREVQLGVVETPQLIELGATDVLYSVAAYELAREEEDEQSATPNWVVKLNQAVVYLHAGDLQGAIQLLRSFQAPAGERLGQAQVDYLLGLALSSAGGEYAQTAAGFLSRAAEEADGRLYHDDGPLIAPRAEVRLQALN
ncbi:MAG: PDZ domain-containing protein [Thermoanaerobaculia bacterium]|nr:PDZ domain-containing protein [Thermoanaerobaculia bacterium]